MQREMRRSTAGPPGSPSWSDEPKLCEAEEEGGPSCGNPDLDTNGEKKTIYSKFNIYVIN